MKLKELLCKYFANEPMYYDSKTDNRISMYQNVIDGDNNQYAGYDNPDDVKKCYAIREVTVGSFFDELIWRFLIGILILCSVGVITAFGYVWCHRILNFNNLDAYLMPICVLVIIIPFVIIFVLLYDRMRDYKITTCKRE